MVEIGYTLSCEELGPRELVRLAAGAEEAGFTFALVSDHYHPWVDAQGQSPFVWTVIGGVAQVTDRLRLGTGVTCPTTRIHPAIVAQAAATAAEMMPGRFFLGVGTGEYLNEHILGDYWPPAPVRLEMLEEAIEVIRLLWQGGTQRFEGAHFTVHDARLYTLPDEPPPIMVAAGGPRAATLAGEAGDGLIAVSAEAELVDRFHDAGGNGKPRIAQTHVCWGSDEEEARRTARRWWPNAALEGELGQELRLPRHFEQATAPVREEDVAEVVLCGPDPERHVANLNRFVDAGFDNVYVHQIGPDQDGFLRFYERDVLPKVA